MLLEWHWTALSSIVCCNVSVKLGHAGSTSCLVAQLLPADVKLYTQLITTSTDAVATHAPYALRRITNVAPPVYIYGMYKSC